MLTGKKILLGVTGSIAAYKSAFLVRLLVQAGAEVKVVMTSGALEFVTPLTFSTLSQHPVYSDFTQNKDQGTWVNHVELAHWADLIVLAPVTAGTLSKMAHAQSDNFLMAVYMSAVCEVMVAPAMDREMYLHAGTRENLEKLKNTGHLIIEPVDGPLASGLSGKGRLQEPEHIFDAIRQFFNPQLPLLNKYFLVTAGPTYERIDPVRFIGNFSTGKMGIEIAKALADSGARVKLVCGPIHMSVSNPLIERIDVESAEEMLHACERIWPEMDGAIMSAAVADFRPKSPKEQKIKKDKLEPIIELENTVDIIARLGELKNRKQVLIGFALETENELEHARKKMEQKKMDMIVLNSLNDKGAGFASETNKITLIWPDNKSLAFGLKSKSEVASDIVFELSKLMNV